MQPCTAGPPKERNYLPMTLDHVDFYFDPICPYAFETSKWIREVRAKLGLDISWRFFSLETVNLPEGNKLPWERSWSWSWSMMRIAAHLRRLDPDLMDRWYLLNGTSFFEQGEPVFLPEGARAVVRKLGLADDVVDEALADDSTHAEVKSDHDRLVTEHGGHGVPTLVFQDGQALFGPVVMPAPEGTAALELWETVNGWLRLPHLYELRRPKTESDLQHIDRHIANYNSLRPWRPTGHPAS